MRTPLQDVYGLLSTQALQAALGDDPATFQRLARLPGLLGGVTALCFLLHRSSTGQMPSLEQFLTHTAPMLLQQFTHVSQTQRVTLLGHTRGRVDWAATYKARYAQNMNPALFVCLPTWRGFDLPENQLFKFMLNSLRVCLERVSPTLYDWEAWGYVVRAPDGKPRPVGAELAHLAQRLRSFNSHAYLREVTLPPVISSQHILAARTSKNELYSHVADLYDAYQAIVDTPDWARWQTVTRAVLPLLPAMAREVGQLLTGHAPGGKRMSTSQKITSTGIRAKDGRPAVEIDVDGLYDLIRVERAGVKDSEVKARTMMGPPLSVSPGNLAKARWGLILPSEPLTADEQQHVQALQPLIGWRCQQMKAKDAPIFHYKVGWRYFDFLRDDTYGQGVVDVGTMDTSIIPYYLCIVGSPDRIPWEFQQYLDGEYAVGRLWFDDAADCAAYVQHVLNYEQVAASLAIDRDALFVATEHPGDMATTSSVKNLISPLRQWVVDNSTLSATPLIGTDATKVNLLRRLKGQTLDGQASQHPPAVLLASTHGVEHSYGDVPYAEQAATEGALLMQEWPADWNALLPDTYVQASDIDANVQLDGLFAFLFGCFSGGSPQMEDWIPPGAAQSAQKRADRPFAARLPQKLLSHGALGCVGHVSRVWNYSFLGAALQKQQLSNFYDVLYSVLRGDPIGHAVDSMNLRWVKMSQQLDEILKDPKHTAPGVVGTWMVRNDFRGYVVCGDPAARLRLNAITE